MRDISLFLCYNGIMIISFFGHANFSEKNKYEKPLFDLLCQLCKNANSVEFLLGGYGNFDSFAYNVCLEFKKAKKKKIKVINITNGLP